MFWKTFPPWLLWYRLFFENVDVSCIIKPQIISISKAVLVVSLKGKRENESVEMRNMQEIQSNWSRTLIAKQSPLSEPLSLTMPHLIWSWQLRVYLQCTEVWKTLYIASTILFLLFSNAAIICCAFCLSVCEIFLNETIIVLNETLHFIRELQRLFLMYINNEEILVIPLSLNGHISHMEKAVPVLYHSLFCSLRMKAFSVLFFEAELHYVLHLCEFRVLVLCHSIPERSISC